MKKWLDIPGWFDYDAVYTEAVSRLPGGVLVEVGNFLGRSLCRLGELVKMSGKPFRVVGVDTCRGSGPEEPYGVRAAHDPFAGPLAEGGGTFAGQLHRNVIDCGLADVVTLVVGDSARVAELFADESLAFVFIDGMHDEESVARDILAWRRKVRVGGVMAGDDMGVPNEITPVWPGVKAAVDKLLKGWQYWPHDAWWWDKKEEA